MPHMTIEMRKIDQESCQSLLQVCNSDLAKSVHLRIFLDVMIDHDS